MEEFATDPKEEYLIQDYGDEFYEEIEAPKFVDFTDPDRSRPDDSSWFCVRIGCDQKHEKVDPDALYKSFVLRVMAARSPNLRLRKALSRRAPSAILKCPRSAPAKSAKDRIPRLTMMTSISQKARDSKVKVSLISKLNLTPSNGKTKKSSITGKALTTPRHKNCPQNQEPFRSVRNPKVTPALPKSSTAAKALVFHSPKKTEKTTSFKCHNISTPDICSEMRKLAISSQTKKAAGHFCKSLRNAARDPNCSVPTSSPAKSQLCASKQHRNQAKVSSISRGFKGREVPSKYLKKVGKVNLQKCDGSMPQRDGDDSSDMEIDGKSRNGSMEACPNGCEGSLKDAKSSKLGDAITTEEEESLPSSREPSIKENTLSRSEKDQTSNRVVAETETVQSSDTESTSVVGVANTTEEESFPSSDDSSIRENSLSNSEEDLQEKDPIIQTLSVVAEEAEIMERVEKNLEENNRTSNGGVDDETEEPIEIADKENASASDENRDVNVRGHHSESKVGHHKVHENPQKVNTSKTTHESTATSGTQGGKYKKAKPTNPKPFRLRTDERGILKEANLERRLQLLAPSKETTPVSKLPNGNLHKRPPPRNELQNGMVNGRCRRNSNTQESSQIESDKTVQKANSILQQRMRPASLKSARSADSKTAAQSPQIHKLKDGREKVTKEIQNRSPKSPSLRQQLLKPGRAAASPGQLAVIKEAPHEDIVENSTTAAAARSSSRGKRPVTVPKEPMFHRMHVPKSCTKTPVKATS
ncbi:uncharacterized protein LOC131218845 isoform X2 [Magnolia sinica]|uniref:uncharacterized protein LOC131218845 isoform X2 n=1 Tax=Magnolia sinica TaxID=86752 RepID=UPI0026594C99|nr:uncharacterized protein LOC131218845 isoform X2 [Magnolia sinica]